MDPLNRPTGRHFLMRPNDLERIRALKGTPFYESRLAKAKAYVADLVRLPAKPWDGDSDIASHTQDHRVSGLYAMTMLYLLTGDETYGRGAVHDTLVMAQVSESNSARRISGSSIEETMICTAMLFVHEWLSELLTEADRERIRQTCLRTLPHHAHEMARSTVNQKQVQNHLLLESTGMALAMLYFNDIQDAQLWGDFSADLAVRYFRDAFHEDGVQNEAATTYHTLCLVTAFILIPLLRDFNDRDLMKEEWFRSVMKKSMDWLASLVAPDGSIIALNDSHRLLSGFYLRFGASHFKNAHYQALADRLDSHQELRRPNIFFDFLFYDPSVKAQFDPEAPKVFPQGGTISLRDGFGTEDGLLVHKVGSYKGGHAHLDRLGLAYWWKGKCLLDDLGGYNSKEDPIFFGEELSSFTADEKSAQTGVYHWSGGRCFDETKVALRKKAWPIFVGYYKQSTSHSVVAIHKPWEISLEEWPELGEKSFPVPHRGHKKSCGRILNTEDSNEFGWTETQAEIYAGVLQSRNILWSKPSGALLIWDRIESDEVHQFDQLFQGVGELTLREQGFVFENEDWGLAASLLTQDGEVVAFDRPEGAKGSARHPGIRKKGRSVNYLTLLEPFQGKAPEERALDAKGRLTVDLAGQKLEIVLKGEQLSLKLNDQDIG